MKRAKYLMVAVLSMVILVFTTGCEIPDSTNSEVSDSDESSGYAEGQILVDNDVVKVIFTEIYEEPSIENACYLRWMVENKSDKKITVYLKDAYVNDTFVQMLSGIPMTIEPGKKSRIPYFFTGYTKDNVNSFEFKVWVKDENSNTLVETETLTAIKN